MNKIDCTKVELLNILITIEGALKDSKGMVLAVEKGTSLLKESLIRRKRNP